MSTFKSCNETEFIFSEEFSPYTVVTNNILNEENLSFKAKGIYCKIVQYQNSPTHVITKSGLVSSSKDGKESVSTGIDELVNYGYLGIIQLRDEQGRFQGVKYKVYQKPVKSKTSETLETQHVAPKPDFTFSDFPTTEKPPLKKKITKKESSKKENNRTLSLSQDDDRSISTNQSSSFNQNNIDLFLLKYSEVMNQDYILTDVQKTRISNLFERYGEKAVLTAINNISKSDYLQANNNPCQFIKHFVKIYNGDYTTRVVPDTPKPKEGKEFIVKKTRFNMINSHDWDWDELDRLEEQRLDKIIKNSKFKERNIDTIDANASNIVTPAPAETLTPRQQEMIDTYTNDPFGAYRSGYISDLEYLWLASHKKTHKL